MNMTLHPDNTVDFTATLFALVRTALDIMTEKSKDFSLAIGPLKIIYHSGNQIVTCFFLLLFRNFLTLGFIVLLFAIS